MSRKFWKPKDPRWGVATAVLAALALAGYLGATLSHPLAPGRGAGLWFGVLATILFVVETLYPARRKLLAKPLGNARRWIQLHIWGGLLAALFVAMHEGFRKPGGTIGWLLLLLTLWVTASGLLGVFLQKFYPVALSQSLSVEALFERIPDLVARLPLEADKAIDGASEVLTGFYRSEVRPSLSAVAPSWGYLIDVRGGRDVRLLPFQRITQFLPQEEHARLQELRTIFVEKMELDAQYSVQRILKTWTVLHVPPAAVLMGLTAVHIVSFFLY